MNDNNEQSKWYTIAVLQLRVESENGLLLCVLTPLGDGRWMAEATELSRELADQAQEALDSEAPQEVKHITKEARRTQITLGVHEALMPAIIATEKFGAQWLRNEL
jgi:hypothetical protein